MKTLSGLSVAACFLAVGLIGCGGGEPSPPANAPTPPANTPAPPANTGEGVPADNVTGLTARIESTAVADGFPKALVLEISVAEGLHWNNDGKPPTLTLAPPEGVRVSKTTVVFPNTDTENDTAVRIQKVGLAVDPAAGDAWQLKGGLHVFVCREDICLPPRTEAHTVTAARGE